MLVRGGQVRATVIPDRKHNITEKIVRGHVLEAAEVHTDCAPVNVDFSTRSRLEMK